ncbi:hypothetical protein BDZ45DRAFT_741208 [Acephala macrosclerotiorum]|nr:hypothetical protein BDZ45DRAFT_741208 [Acephala macrosclerotiorum]
MDTNKPHVDLTRTTSRNQNSRLSLRPNFTKPKREPLRLFALDPRQCYVSREPLPSAQGKGQTLLRGVPFPPDNLYRLLDKRNVDPPQSHSKSKTEVQNPVAEETNTWNKSPPKPPIGRSTTLNEVERNIDQRSLCTLSPSSSISANSTAVSTLTSSSSISGRSIAPCTPISPTDKKARSTEFTPKEDASTITSKESSSLVSNEIQTEVTSLSKQDPTTQSIACSSQVSALPLAITSYTVISIDKKCYVSPEMPIPADKIKIWEGLKQRLEDALCHLSTATHDSEAGLALEFYMASTSKKGLVDKTFGHRTSGPRIGSPVIEARITTGSVTLCGTAARIRSSASQGSSQEELKSTLGGVICIGEDFAVLTAGHPFLPSDGKAISLSSGPSLDSSFLDSDASDSDSSMSRDSEDEMKSESDMGDFEVVEHSSALFGVQSLPSVTSSTTFVKFRHEGIISHVQSLYLKTQLISQSTMHLGNPDWAVLLMDLPSPQLFPNSIYIPGVDNSTTFIKDIIPKNQLTSGPV